MEPPLESVLELAREWWQSRMPHGFYRTEEGIFSDVEVERVFHVEDALDVYIADENTLGHALECLVATAPRDADLPFIGTWHIENAYDTYGLGDKALSILEACGFGAETKAAIMSGFQK